MKVSDNVDRIARLYLQKLPDRSLKPHDTFWQIGCNSKGRQNYLKVKKATSRTTRHPSLCFKQRFCSNTLLQGSQKACLKETPD